MGRRKLRKPPRPIVEECLILDVVVMNAQGMLKEWNKLSGKMAVHNQANGNLVNYSHYEIKTNDKKGLMTLQNGEEVIELPLESTRPFYGGSRWWFKCLLCQHKVEKIYLPPEGKIFACRICHNLRYRSDKMRYKAINKIVNKAKSVDEIFTMPYKDETLLEAAKLFLARKTK